MQIADRVHRPAQARERRYAVFTDGIIRFNGCADRFGRVELFQEIKGRKFSERFTLKFDSLKLFGRDCRDVIFGLPAALLLLVAASGRGRLAFVLMPSYIVYH